MALCRSYTFAAAAFGKRRVSGDAELHPEPVPYKESLPGADKLYDYEHLRMMRTRPPVARRDRSQL